LKSDAFQADLYPECIGDKPSLTVAEFFNGVTRPPTLISLEHGFEASVPKAFSTNAPAPVAEEKGPQSDKEYQDAYHTLRRENEDLKNAVSMREARIVQLEAQLGSN
jgi:coronin-1B/1C/6